jgi:two-component system, OmpR family, response regulator
MRILVTEDDDDLRLSVQTCLRTAGFAVDAAVDLSDADKTLWVNAYDCAVFDRMLPDGDSLRYVARRRSRGWPVPVLFLTARDEIGDRIDGLEVGDDYLVKPFANVELIARVRSLCRRGAAAPAPVLRFSDVELDPGRHLARRGGIPLELTAKEFAVLRLLVAAGGETVPRKDLLAVWDELVAPSSNVLDVLMLSLRKKLGAPALVHTVRGVGYLLR